MQIDIQKLLKSEASTDSKTAKINKAIKDAEKAFRAKAKSFSLKKNAILQRITEQGKEPLAKIDQKIKDAKQFSNPEKRRVFLKKLEENKRNITKKIQDRRKVQEAKFDQIFKNLQDRYTDRIAKLKSKL